MKVKYIKTHTDEFGDVFQPGWVAEHTDAEGARRVALGVCVEVDPGARAFKYQPDAELSIETCVTEDEAAPSPFQNSPPLVVASKSKK